MPGVSISTGSPASSAAVRQAATSGSTAITAVPVAAPQRAAAAPSEPTPTGTITVSNAPSISANSVA